MKNRVGVDIGGTNIKIALITNEGKILYSKTFPTEAEKGYEYTVANIKEEIKVLMTETESTSKTIETIGFGFPGQIDYKTGTVKVSTNIPGWNGVELAKIIKEEFNVPAFVDNDVKVLHLEENPHTFEKLIDFIPNTIETIIKTIKKGSKTYTIDNDKKQ